MPHFEKDDAIILNMSVPPARQCHFCQGEVLALRALGDLLQQCLQYPAPSVCHMEARGKWHLRFFVQVTELSQLQK